MNCSQIFGRRHLYRRYGLAFYFETFESFLFSRTFLCGFCGKGLKNRQSLNRLTFPHFEYNLCYGFHVEFLFIENYFRMSNRIKVYFSKLKWQKVYLIGTKKFNIFLETFTLTKVRSQPKINSNYFYANILIEILNVNVTSVVLLTLKTWFYFLSSRPFCFSRKSKNTYFDFMRMLCFNCNILNF